MILEGIYPIVPTPFLADSSLDLASIERLINFMADKKVRGLAIMGALGEGHKLTEQERAEVISAYRARLPEGMHLIVGVRAPATDPAVKMVRSARNLGADAILLGPHNIQKDTALLGYYQQVAKAAQIPCVIHDYPAVTGITMSVELIGKMFETAPNINHIKLEDPPTGAKMQALAESAGPGLNVFGALGGMYAFEELERGAVGVMTGFVYAELLVQLFDLCHDQQWEQAAGLFYDFLPLIRWEFQPGIGVSLRKHVLKRLGVFTTAKVRHPGPDADPKTVKQLFRIVRHLIDKGYPLAL
ncbi:MAG: dihydrodipicolinate synthase family protein [Desulfosarcina sp.]|nr:dihydrodipicolinate synthase family protein [Desulfosarcina sp.]MBC2742675.1 dihydrodipicolinate synthase family protein [Desulfosarcina sp.]MBC2765585.1 dihydrodipicolinate synthase family protein [Desulfosarcina sp.]